MNLSSYYWCLEMDVIKRFRNIKPLIGIRLVITRNCALGSKFLSFGWIVELELFEWAVSVTAAVNLSANLSGIWASSF